MLILSSFSSMKTDASEGGGLLISASRWLISWKLPGPVSPRLLVAESAIVVRGGLEIAWVVGADGRASLRYVRTGSRRDGRVEVLSGLEAGERVVLGPPADLEGGTRVTS